jgi:hypothetical protein
VTENITLNDLLSKEPDEIVSSLVTERCIYLKPLKQQLKGFFQDGENLIEYGYQFRLDHNTLEIMQVLKASGRVFFKVKETGQKFSMSLAALTSDTTPFPYKDGDFVTYTPKAANTVICEVIGLNPSSRHVVIYNEDLNIRKKVPLSKVSMYAGELETTDAGPID